MDGFFIGNSIGDLGLSAVNIAYPVVGVIQALGTGIGMGGAIYYSIYKAEKKEEQAKNFIAGALWVLIISSVLATILDYLFVWRLGQGVPGVAWATVIGQGVTMLTALAWLLCKKQFTLNIPFSKFGKVSASFI